MFDGNMDRRVFVDPIAQRVGVVSPEAVGLVGRPGPLQPNRSFEVVDQIPTPGMDFHGVTAKGPADGINPLNYRDPNRLRNSVARIR